MVRFMINSHPQIHEFPIRRLPEASDSARSISGPLGAVEHLDISADSYDGFYPLVISQLWKIRHK